jgi:hypothetical protein
MKNISTDIIIYAPKEIVWQVLTDFSSYPDWNPFIKSFKVKPEKGKRFKVVIQQPGSKPMTFSPVCLELSENTKFRWLGSLGFKGIFDGEHIFELFDEENGKTRFVHREKFNGILVPLLWKQLNVKTRNGLEMMNEALKERAEKVYRNIPA